MATLNGLEAFKTHFAGYSDHYVLIGGVACSLWHEAAGLAFRATKDFDVVLLAENLTPEFARQVWAFVEAAGYHTRERSDPEHKYYRFTHPQDERYPALFELFTRSPQELDLPLGQTITPLPVDDSVSSLSAILLDGDYYSLIREHKQLESGLPLAPVSILIALKAKAWLDLTARKQDGEKIDTNHIAKHRTDVFRLTLLLDDETTLTLPKSVDRDLRLFLDAFPPSSVEWPAIHASLKSTGSPVLPATALRQAISQSFRIMDDVQER